MWADVDAGSRPTGLEVIAPLGLQDTVGMVLRPNHRLAPREIYEAKAAAYVERWPQLRVEPW